MPSFIEAFPNVEIDRQFSINDINTMRVIIHISYIRSKLFKEMIDNITSNGEILFITPKKAYDDLIDDPFSDDKVIMAIDFDEIKNHAYITRNGEAVQVTPRFAFINELVRAVTGLENLPSFEEAFDGIDFQGLEDQNNLDPDNAAALALEYTQKINDEINIDDQRYSYSVSNLDDGIVVDANASLNDEAPELAFSFYDPFNDIDFQGLDDQNSFDSGMPFAPPFLHARAIKDQFSLGDQYSYSLADSDGDIDPVFDDNSIDNNIADLAFELQDPFNEMDLGDSQYLDNLYPEKTAGPALEYANKIYKELGMKEQHSSAGFSPNGDLIIGYNYTDGEIIELALYGDIWNTELNMLSSRDLVIGSNAMSVLSTGAGDDFLYGQGGMDILRSGEGHDKIDAGPDNDYIDAGAGDDKILGGADDDILYSGEGKDHFDGGEGIDILDFRSSPSEPLSFGISLEPFQPDNRIVCNLAEGFTLSPDNDDGHEKVANIEIVYTGNSDDILLGDENANILDAGPGNDAVSGGPGEDKVTGGPGADYFIFNDGDDRDVISDFQPSYRLHNYYNVQGDVVVLNVDSVKTYSALLDRAKQDDDNVVFQFNDSDVLVLENTNLADLNADAFNFI